MSRNPIALALRSHVDTPAFRNWFGASRVLGERGQPLVLFHGTTKDFVEFKAGEGDLGIHFGTSGQANRRIENGGCNEGARVIPVFLSIKNPLRLKDAGGWRTQADVSNIITDRMMDDNDFAEAYARAADAVDSSLGFKGVLEYMGYDGVVYGNVGEEDLDWGEEAGDDSWIAFRPEQIKSAISNGGEFCPDNPNFCMSRVARYRERLR